MFEPTGEDLVGLECEWPLRDRADPRARPTMPDLQSVALTPLPGGGRVTIEPGGQIELSSYPSPTVSEALDQVEGDALEMDDRLCALGFDSEYSAVDHSRDPLRILQAPRYDAMESFFDAQGRAGRWMMCNTSSIQVNVSNDGADPTQRWYTLNRIAPALLATFANSRGVDASGTTWASLRQGIWASIDPGRTSPVRLDADPAEAWLSYALSAQVLFVPKAEDGSFDGVGVGPGLPFGAWLALGSDLGHPTLEDFRYHLSTLFPPVRPRGWMELRVLDAVPVWMRAAVALAVTTAVQSDVAAELQKRMPDVSDLYLEAALHGLSHPTIAQASATMMEIVDDHAHLVTDRVDHLEQLHDFTDRYTRRGRCPGDDLWSTLPIALRSEAPAMTAVR